MIKHRRLPHLTALFPQPITYLTVVTAGRSPVLANAAAFETLTRIWSRSPEQAGWFVGDYMLMPDHIHLFARSALDARPLGDWMEAWKSCSSRDLKIACSIEGSFWQRDYFDRFLRSAESYSEKWDYVAMNPVRARLCARPEDWPWKGRLFGLEF